MNNDQLKIQWHTELREVSELNEWSKNPRKITEKDYLKLIESIKDYGFHDVLKVDFDGTILSGHQRKRALIEIGITHVHVMVPDRQLTEKEREIVAIASNMHRGTFDDDILANEFDIPNLLEAGFTKNDLSMFDLSEDDFDEDEELKKLGDPKSLQGEVYLLGRHRLMCGDATNLEAVQKLMGDSKARMVFTDPPYGVNYVAGIKKTEEGGETKHKDIKNDDLKGHKLFSFLKDAFLNAFESSTKDATIYSWFANSTYPEFRNALEESGWRYGQVIVWIKQRFVLSRADYHHAFEPCMYGWKQDEAHFSNKKYRKFDDVILEKNDLEEHMDVWFIDRDKMSDYHHPTQKPLKLAERALRMSTTHGDVVLDLFGGSGFLLMAAEQSQRQARIMELDQRYVDLMLNRWAAFTGEDPIRESDGKAWSLIKSTE